MKASVILLAAGAGQRAGGSQPKQLQTLGAKPVFVWPLEVFAAHQAIMEIVLVVPPGTEEDYGMIGLPEFTLVEGGKTRRQSVRYGLEALKKRDDDIVLIHDAARPGLEAGLIDALLEALQRYDAAAPALPVSDALKHNQDGQIKTVPREGLYRIQTPQAFRFGHIFAGLSKYDRDYVDDLAAIEDQGLTVGFVQGSERLAKITYPEDLSRMERVLTAPALAPRMGTGFDVHAFEPGDYITLCGVSIPHERALKGHSDADVGWHALTDAILGACALGDIGDHFPPSDPQWANADSALFLIHAQKLALEAGYRLANCDLTLICEAPKIKPHREAMRHKTAELLELSIDQISIKATTTEKLGFTGRQEGIAAQAAAVLVPK